MIPHTIWEHWAYNKPYSGKCKFSKISIELDGSYIGHLWDGSFMVLTKEEVDKFLKSRREKNLDSEEW